MKKLLPLAFNSDTLLGLSTGLFKLVSESVFPIDTVNAERAQAGRKKTYVQRMASGFRKYRKSVIHHFCTDPVNRLMIRKFQALLRLCSCQHRHYL